MKKALIFSLFLVSGILVFAQEKTINKTFSNIKTIKLSTASGDIDLKKGSGSEVKLTIRYTYDDASFKPMIDANGGKLTIKEEFERNSNSGSAKWSLEIPANVELDVNTGSGDIAMDQLASKIRSNTGSGDIEASAIKGDFKANAGSGNLTLTNIEGDMDVNTGSGDIRVENASGSFQCNAGSGDIKLDQIRGDFSVNVGSGDIMAKAVTITGTSKFNSGSGNATVALSKPLDHNLSINSGSGDAVLNFNGNEISGLIIMSANKRGGDIVAPFKFDKEETVDEGGSSDVMRKTAKIGSKDITIKVSTGSGTAEIKK